MGHIPGLWSDPWERWSIGGKIRQGVTESEILCVGPASNAISLFLFSRHPRVMVLSRV